ncbi:MAG: hypothetical protein GC203_02855 [Phenylobacterium sp.]|uniref:hypothetical protein n=1 Tax=Phenylobacterium sp. TaxID=1871053 RepID=UPI0025FA85F9|nr:hypothetical protein [Phenylobacterium sp.]MBI1196779.1 hypothetical protein [Phenylobacterium sp.]
MNGAEPPRIVAAVGGEAERAAAIAAGEQLSAAVAAVLGAAWPIRLRPIALDEPDIPPGIVLIAAPLADLAAAEPVDAAEARWTARIARYRAAGHDRILICNLFRGVGASAGVLGGIERIRRLNRMVVGLSHRLGVEIVDVDRLLALCGARAFARDPRGSQAATARAVGHAIADAILQGDMGGSLDATVQARAGAVHRLRLDVQGLVERPAARVAGP